MKIKNPSDALDKIKEKAEKQGDRQLPINTEIVTIIADEWDKMFSEIRELMETCDRNHPIYKTMDTALIHLSEKNALIAQKDAELALKDKRIAELEAELTDKNLPPLEWAKIHAKDREQARSQGRNEAIAEIEPIIIEMASLDMKQKESYKKNPDVIATVYFETNWDLLLRKIASMKKAKA